MRELIGGMDREARRMVTIGDPLELVFLSMMELSWDVCVPVRWEPELDTAANQFARTAFEEDCPAVIKRIDLNPGLSMIRCAYFLAHELAHVQSGYKAGHGATWWSTLEKLHESCPCLVLSPRFDPSSNGIVGWTPVSNWMEFDYLQACALSSFAAEHGGHINEAMWLLDTRLRKGEENCGLDLSPNPIGALVELASERWPDFNVQIRWDYEIGPLGNPYHIVTPQSDGLYTIHLNPHSNIVGASRALARGIAQSVAHQTQMQNSEELLKLLYECLTGCF